MAERSPYVRFVWPPDRRRRVTREQAEFECSALGVDPATLVIADPDTFLIIPPYVEGNTGYEDVPTSTGTITSIDHERGVITYTGDG